MVGQDARDVVRVVVAVAGGRHADGTWWEDSGYSGVRRAVVGGGPWSSGQLLIGSPR